MFRARDDAGWLDDDVLMDIASDMAWFARQGRRWGGDTLPSEVDGSGLTYLLTHRSIDNLPKADEELDAVATRAGDGAVRVIGLAAEPIDGDPSAYLHAIVFIND